MSEMDSIIKEFVAESNENLDQLDRDLVDLEQNPSSADTLGRVFRTVHSIKGATGFLGFTKLGEVAHTGEGLLSRLRDGAIIFNPEITRALLSLVDALRKMLSDISEKGHESDEDYTHLMETLNRLRETGHAEAITTDSALQPASHENLSLPERGVDRSFMSPTGTARKAGAKTDESEDKHGTDDDSEGPPASGANQTSSAAEPSDRQTDSRSSPVEHASLRVDVRKLDALMDLVGELVLARNQILQTSWRLQDPNSLSTAQRLNLITTQLQEEVAKTRLQPIANIWLKFPRMVRDLAIQCGKKIRLSMEGDETDLDKTILEALKDPLTHLVRNAIDHGIETPDIRLRAGKSAEGNLVLCAFHENGQVIIEISDDGAGIDLTRVRDKAVEHDLVSSETSHLMNEADVLNLIFLPGFSTAKSVTTVSGRGVGMDVVKTNIEQINGTVEIRNRPGSGTTIRIRIPLTLAIIPALMVNVGGKRYAIPQAHVIELLGLHDLESKKQIERIQGVTLCRLRGRLLPLVSLSEILEANSDPLSASSVVREGTRSTMVVLQSQESQFGIAVDEVINAEEIVVKPLGKHLKNARIYAGATIMGDGRVALILDVHGLARLVSRVSDANVRDSSKLEIPQAISDGGFEKLLLLMTLGFLVA